MATSTSYVNRARSPWTRASIMVGLLLALVMMHGVPNSSDDVMDTMSVAAPASAGGAHAGDAMPATPGESTPHESDHHEGLLHLCFAVLFAGALLVIGWGRSRRAITTHRRAALTTPGWFPAIPTDPLRLAKLQLLRC